MLSNFPSSRSINSTKSSTIKPSMNSIINSSNQKNEWYCHCCSAKNDIKNNKCRVCGRPDTYADGPHLPLHDIGRYVLRSNQVETLLPEDRIHDHNEQKWTALHSCASVGNHELVLELLNRGSEIEATTSEGYTPLHLAVYSGSLETVAVICSKKCNINAQTFFELNTPLHIAVQEGWKILCQYLIGAGASRTIVNALGRSPLHIAAMTGRIDIGHYFLENEIYSVFDKDGMGWTVQQIAEYYDHHDFEELCQRYSMTDNQYKIREIQKGDWDSELWRDVIHIRRKNEEKIINDEIAYTVRTSSSSSSSQQLKLPFMDSISLANSTLPSTLTLTSSNLSTLGNRTSKKGFNFTNNQNNSNNPTDGYLSPISISTSRSFQPPQQQRTTTTNTTAVTNTTSSNIATTNSASSVNSELLSTGTKSKQAIAAQRNLSIR